MNRKNNSNSEVSKSWFCVFDNPELHGVDGTPEEVVDKLIALWIQDNPQRTCAVTYCISADGLKHCHAVFEDTKAMRFTTIKKLFPSMHIEPTKGDKAQAEEYINKRGKWEETGEQIIHSNRYGEIKGRQGQRNDLEIIEELIHLGRTPNEIMDMSLAYRRHDKIIREAYYRKRFKETPAKREVTVYWHVGESGSGKSYTEIKLAEIHGEDSIYKISEHESGFADKYSGQTTLIIDEFRGQIRYEVLLTMLDCYKSQIHARYTNIYSLWNEVHITSVFPPEILYSEMIRNYRKIDTYEQLRRRINFMVYHYRIGDEYCILEIPMSEYVDYKHLKNKVEEENSGIVYGIVESVDINDTPFGNGTNGEK